MPHISLYKWCELSLTVLPNFSALPVKWGEAAWLFMKHFRWFQMTHKIGLHINMGSKTRGAPYIFHCSDQQQSSDIKMVTHLLWYCKLFHIRNKFQTLLLNAVVLGNYSSCKHSNTVVAWHSHREHTTGGWWTSSRSILILQKEVLLYETQSFFFWVDSRSILNMGFSTNVTEDSYSMCLYPRQCGPQD
jgi:hypothetical protein